MSSQFLHLGAYGIEPAKKNRRWECIAGVTQEGARVPHASQHVLFPREPVLLHGISPIDAGRIAEERARQAVDATGKRKLHRDGIALLAGVASYPVERKCVDEDPLDQDIYALWKRKVIEWLRRQFGEHLLSVVEHVDETYYHLHFYVVPVLDERKRLNLDLIHPGRYARAVAEAEGADHKNAERSYRKGMRLWQDAFHREVSSFFRHDRYGPKRARVSRREHEMQRRIEEDGARRLADLEQEAAAAHDDARRRGWERYAGPYRQLEQHNARLEAACAAEAMRRRSAEAEIAALRAQLAALQPPPTPYSP
jgi:hypothetical protein